jgi:hypothetical protein
MVPANSKSELVTLPVGLWLETSFRCIASGNRARHRMGLRLEWVVAASHTPPIPVAAASTAPRAAGTSGTSSESCVGRRPRSLARYSKSSSWARIAGVIRMRFLSVYLNPVCSRLKRPLLPGMPRTMDRNSPRILCHFDTLTRLL